MRKQIFTEDQISRIEADYHSVLLRKDPVECVKVILYLASKSDFHSTHPKRSELMRKALKEKVEREQWSDEIRNYLCARLHNVFPVPVC